MEKTKRKYADIYENSIFNRYDGYGRDSYPKKWEIVGETETLFSIRRRIFCGLKMIESTIDKDHVAIERVYEE